MTEADGEHERPRLLFVAANPSVDRLYEVDQLAVSEIHRPRSVTTVPGGKGLNAARAAALLGGSVTAVGIFAGRAGDWIVERLAEIGIDTRPVRAGGETRTCISILDRSTGELTEIYERGSEIEGSAWDALEQIISSELQIGDIATIALSGSLPRGAPNDGFGRIAGAAGRAPRPVAVLADTYGEALTSVLAERPTIVKLNAAEAAEASGLSVGDASSAAVAAGVLQRRGAGCVIVTLGVEGAVVMSTVGATHLIPPDIRGSYPVGSGDAFLGGLMVAHGRESIVEAARFGMAAAIANAQTPGAGELDPNSIERIFDQIASVAM